MSTTDPAGEGGGGGGGEATTIPSTNVEQNTSPVTPVSGSAMPLGSQQQHPPPSPLSGCYLLVVLPEPHTAQHKDLILNRLSKGFLSWDKDSCHVDLEKELLALVAQAPEGEEARNGERLIQYATENLVTEVLIHPQTNTLLQCIRNLLASFTKHRHIIHAGYTFGGNGSWILQDGTFSVADFLDAFSEHEVQRVLRAYENSVTVDIHCAGVGDWATNRLSKEACTRSCRVRVNPDDVLTAGVPAITSFSNYIGQYLVAQTLDQLMEPSDVVGNIRFSHPTLYVFPGGQGDAALFGINGFNMLVDGGFARKACFWDFTRHLDRLDAVLVTRINNSNVGGMSSVLRKKKEMHVYPQIGHFFCNLVERRQSNSPDGDKDIDPLILNLTDIGQEMVVNLRHINLRAHPCYRDPDPINLYHKVGHGTLDMYVLSPSKDSREVREFVVKWHASDSKLFTGSHKKDSNNLTFPIQNLVSICALLVWQPANPEDTITRILFPGSTPQHKIFEGFERLKHLEFLKHPVCSAKSLSPSTSLATLRDKPAKQKLSLIEKESSKKLSDVKKEKRETSEVKVGKGGGGGGGGGDETPAKSIPQGTPPIIPTKPQGAKIEVKTKKAAENKRIEVEVKEAKESKKIEKELKEVSKKEAVTKREAVKMEKQTAEKPEKTEEKFEKREEESLRKSDAAVKTEGEKMMIVAPKESRAKGESKRKEAKEARDAKVGGVKVGRLEAVSAGKPKLAEKKAKQQSYAEKKETGVGVKSSPTTPKKSVNGVATKTEISKASVQRGKLATAQKATTALPAKSAKDANNRKVVEQKNIEKSAIKETAAVGGMAVGSMAKVSVKAKPMDRKPIGRRGKPVSPIKARAPGSPAKSTRSTPTTSVKSDKDGVVRKPKGDKGTTDSSTVSTPSGIEPETAARLVEKSLIEKSEDISLDSIESKVLADLKEEREVVEEIEAVLQKAERIEETRKDDRFEGDDEITAEATDKKQEEDITEEDVTAEIEDAPKKDSLRKGSQELTEEDEYLIVEKEEVYTEDSVQSGEGEQKHILDEAESEKAKIFQDPGLVKEKGEEEGIEEKERDESAEKEATGRTEAEAEAEAKLTKIDKERTEPIDLSPDRREQLDEEEEEEVKDVITSASETKRKAEEKDDSGKKDSDDITKEPSSLSPDKLDSSEKKTTDTDLKPEVDQKEQAPEKLEESQERISTIESGATTTAPTLPEDERIPLDEIKEDDIDEKHIIEEVKEKDVSSKVKKEVAATPATLTVTTTASVAIIATTTVTDTAVTPVPRAAPAATAKPDVPMFDIRQAVQCLQRDIVKTPDEVADLPVHEEVDPKLYRMEDFEKDKEEKALPPAPATAPAPPPEPAPAPAQDVKEPPTPPVKEQKGVFSFFGKVADKFEKGIDKLTKKSKKEHDKDTDEKSSSKSSSPKEAKVQEKTLLEDVDMEKMFLKVSKPSEKVEASEEAEPKIDHVEDDTAALRYEEIIKEDTFDTKATVQHPRSESEPVKDEMVQDVSADVVPSGDKFDTSKDELANDAKYTKDGQAEKEGEEIIAVAVEEETDEIQALLDEASKKFKTVKDSLRDSLESLEGKIGDESVDLSGEIGAVKDTVKDTMDGVVERLERIKPEIENTSPDTREPEKVKFDIPKDEEFEGEYEETAAVQGPVKDIKEAVRDVGEVLAGTAGIDIEDKAKDVTEIVRKVAQVLKGDDFLPEESSVLGETTAAGRKEIASSLTAAKPESPISLKSPISEYTPVKLDEMSGKHEGKIVVMPTKVGITEEFPQQEQEQLGELSIDGTTARVAPVPALATLKSPDKHGIVQVGEEPCVKITTEKDTISSPKDEAKDVRDAKEICEDILKQDLICKSDTEVAPRQVESWKEDVIEAGLEDVCVKEVAKKLSDEEKAREEEVEVPTIGFHQKVSPAKAEIVMVSPGSTPTSPKFVADKIHQSTLASKETAIPVKLPAEMKAIVDSVDRLAADIIQQLVTNKTKITIEIIEYITTIKRLPRERVIYIIEELIVRKELSREDVVDNVDMFKLDEPITPQLRMELEEYIINECVTKGKRITIRVVEEISIKMLVPKTIVIRIIKDIMVKKSIDVSTDDLWESQTEDVEIEEGKEESAKLHRVEEKLTASIEEEFATKKEEEEEEEEEEEDTSRIDAKEAKEAKETEAAKVEVTIQAFVSGEQPVSSRSAVGEEEEEDFEEDGFVGIGRKVSKETIDDFEAVEEEYKVRDVPVTSFDDISPVVPQKLLETKAKDCAEEAVEDTANDVFEADEKFVHETKEKIGKERLDVDTTIDVTLDKQGAKVQDTKERDTTSQLTQVSEALDAVEKYLDEAKEKVDSKIMLVEETATDISALVTATSDSDGGELGTFEPVKETDTSQVPSSTISRESSGTEHVPTAFQPMKEEAKSETPDKDEAKQTEMKATRSAGNDVEQVVAEQVLDKVEEFTQVAGAAPAEESEREVMDRATDEKSVVQVPLKPEVKLADATGRAVEPKAEELIGDAHKAGDTKPQESAEQKDDAVGEDYKSFDESAVAVGHETDKLQSTTKAEQMPPRDVMGSVIQQDEPMHETCVQVKVVTVEEKSKVDQDIGSVRRMLVTASSEDGGHETEICPTGSITFTKTPLTPDDSLKDASVKSTPDKDSLLLDKDSLRSGTSSPENDSISEKSAAEIKDVVGKATPEDSLDKSPVGRHDSQDLEDSLEKAGVEEPKKVDSASPSIDAETTTPKSPQRSEELRSLGTVKPPLEADGTEKVPCSDPLTAEKIQPIKLTDEMVTKLPDAIVQTQESPAKLTKESSQLKSPDRQLFIDTNGISEPALEAAAAAAVSTKSPESAGREDVPPAETDTLSKSPTEKQELAKSPTDTKAAKSKAFERETTPCEMKEPIREIEESTAKSSSDKEDEREILGTSGERCHDTTPVDRTIVEDSKVDGKGKGKEPSTDREYGTIDVGETAERDVDDKKLRSPSIGSDKGDSKDSGSSSADDSGKPSSIANEKLESKESAARSKSPDTSTDKTDEKKSGQVAGDGHNDQLKGTESKVLVEAGDQALDVLKDEGKGKVTEIVGSLLTETLDDVPLLSTVQKSSTAVSDTEEEKDLDDRPEKEKIVQQSTIADQEVSLQVTEESRGERNKSPGAVSTTDESKPLDITDLQKQVAGRRVSSASAESQEAIDRSSSPSVESERHDVKELSEGSTGKVRSPSIASAPGESSIPGELNETTRARSKSPSIAGESSDLKEVEAKTVDKSRSPSVVSVTEESNEPMGPSKSPSVVGESVDWKDDDEATTVDKSRSPSVTSIPGASREEIDDSKSASSGGESADLKDIVANVVDKSRSPSVASVTGKSKETIGRSKSPSVAGDSPSTKDVEAKAVDKSRSPSVASVTEQSEEPMGPSKSPSVVGESDDESKDDDEATTVDKSRSPSVTSVPEAPKETIDDSKSAGLKDVDTRIVDESRSPSVPSVSSEAKEQVDHHRSESPSGVDYKAADSKSRSPSISSSPGETKDTMERSKSPSVAFVESPDSKDIADTKLLVDRSRSPSVTSASVPEEVKESAERSESPGVASEPADVTKVDPKAIDTLASPSITITVGECKEMVDLKEVGATTADRSRSSSIQDAAIEAEDRADRSKSPNIAGESPVLKETEIDLKVIPTTAGESNKEMAEHFDASSVDGESQRPIDVEGKAIDKSGSPSVASVPSAAAEPVDHSKSPSIADEAPELKQVDSKATVTVSKSPSIPTFPCESKETAEHSEESPDRKYTEARAIEKSTSPSAAGYPVPEEPTDQVDGSKSSSIVGESTDLKQVDSKATDSKSRSPSISSSPGESAVTVAVERSKSPSTAGESPNLIDVEGKTIDKSRSPSVTSVPSAPTELADRSKSPSIAGETLDTEYVESKAIDKSVAASLADSTGEPKGQVDRSKSPSIAGELPDLKDVEARVTDKSRSPSVASVPSETKDQIDRSKSPSIASGTPDLKEADSKSTDKSRSPSIATSPSESKETAEHSKAPSVTGKSPDPKDVEAGAIDKSRSPSVTGYPIPGASTDQVDRSESPSIAGESPDLKQVDSIATDKAKSPSIATSPEESKEAADHSMALPLVAGQSPDPKDLEARAIDRSTSPIVTSISGEPEGQVGGSKALSTAGETPDLKETDSNATYSKSRSPSMSSSPDECKETTAVAVERSKPPSTAVESLEGRAIDKSRSASVTSVSSAPTDPADRSKSSSIAAESSDLKEAADRKVSDKSVSPSMPTSPGESPETTERSKPPSVARESPDPKDAEAEAIDKSRSLSAASVSGESSVDQVGRSKSPSITGESPELHEADSRVGVKSISASIPISPGESKPLGGVGESSESKDLEAKGIDKSIRSPSVTSVYSALTEPVGPSKSPSITGESADSNDVQAMSTDKSRASSVTSVTGVPKGQADRSKSPSIIDESPDLKDVEAKGARDESRSPSVTSLPGESEGQVDRSKSPSISREYVKSPDLKEVDSKAADKSRSASPGEIKETVAVEGSKSPSVKDMEAKIALDKSRSHSATSIPGESVVRVDRSKSPSIAGELPHSKDIESKGTDSRSRSPSVTSITGGVSMETMDRKSVDKSSIPGEAEKSSYTKHVDATDTAKSTSPSVPSVFDDVKESEVREAVASSPSPSLSPSVASDMDENVTDKARSRQSVTSVCSDFKEETDRSRSPTGGGGGGGGGGDVGDHRKDVGVTDAANSVAQFVAGVAEEPKGSDHRSKSLSPAGEKEVIDSVPASSVVVAKVGGEAATVAVNSAVAVSEAMGEELTVVASSLHTGDKLEMEGSSSTTASRFMEKGENVVLDLGKERFDRPQEDDKLSCADSPASERAVKDGSRSQSGDETPSTRSRVASVYEEKAPSMDEEKSSESSGRTEDRTSISIATTKVIDKVLGIIDGTGKVTYAVSSGDATEGTKQQEDEQEDDIVKVTAEKKADIEKYILEEYICKKRKITSIMIEKIVMTYSVPEFVVIDIIETVLAREREREGEGEGEGQTGSDSISDLVDWSKTKSSVEARETTALELQKKLEIEKYIMDEYVAKRKKITPIVLDEISAMNRVPRPLLNTIVDEIIVKNNLERIMIIGTDVEKAEDEPKGEIPVPSKCTGGIEFPGIGVAESGKTGDNVKSSSVMHAHEYRDAKDASGGSTSPSLCSEPIASDKSTQDSPARSEPRIDEEISISEEKRTEVEGIVEGEYIRKAKKITDQVLEEIIVRTFLPRYIILEIIEEIILKKQLSRDSVMGVEIYQEDEPADESYEKEDDRYEKARYDYPDTKASAGAEASVSDYPINYESQFHKAFVCGITEIRTTHITTLSGKSTPDMTRDGTPDSTSEPTASTVERIEDKYIGGKAADTHVSPDTAVSSNIGRSEVADVLKSDAAAAAGIIKYVDQSDDASGDKVIVVKKIIKREVVEQQEPEMVTETVMKQRISDEGDPDTAIRKIIKREIIEQREPVVTRNVIERDVIVPDDVERAESSTEVEGGREQGAKMIETMRTETQKTEIISDIASSTDGNRRPVRTAAAVIGSAGSREMPKSDQVLTKPGQPGGSLKEGQVFGESMITSHRRADEGSETEKKGKDVERDGKDIVAEKDKRPASPLVRDITCDSSGSAQLHPSGRSTPDRKPESRSLTGTPEGFRSGEIIRTIITTTKTVSDDGEIVTTTREVTETTNEKGETVVLAEKVDVKVDEYLPSRDAAESAIGSIIDGIKSSELESDNARKKANTTEGGLYGSEKEQQSHSDDGGVDVGVGQSSSTTHAQQSAGTSRQLEQSIGKEEMSVGFSAAAMSSSFYGELPAVPPQISAMKTFQEDVDSIRKSSDPIPIQADYTFKRFTVEKEYAGGYEEKADAKRYVDEADLDFEKALMERKEMKEPPVTLGRGMSPRYTNGGVRQEMSDGRTGESSEDTTADSKKDPLDGWGTPLGLPSPKPPHKFNFKCAAAIQSSGLGAASDNDVTRQHFDPTKDWGEPLRLPSPAPTTNEISNKGAPGTPKKEKKQARKILSENLKNKKRSESPGKNEKKMKDSRNKIQPVYMDLTYVPHHGNSYYTSLEFFKRIRARYYVFSGTEPSREVYDALLEAKRTWEDKDLEVTMIPTYDTDTLGYWVADNEEALAANHIDLSPSASRCTINLQDHETSCSAYRLEF